MYLVLRRVAAVFLAKRLSRVAPGFLREKRSGGIRHLVELVYAGHRPRGGSCRAQGNPNNDRVLYVLWRFLRRAGGLKLMEPWDNVSRCSLCSGAAQIMLSNKPGKTRFDELEAALFFSLAWSLK